MANSSVPVWYAAVLCRCPRCGQGRLFDGLLTVKDECAQCGLNLRASDTGDGPAALVMLVVGPILVGLVFWVEFRFGPPLWVHLVLWPIVGFLLTIAVQRPMKAAMVALQYRLRSTEMEL